MKISLLNLRLHLRICDLILVNLEVIFGFIDEHIALHEHEVPVIRRDTLYILQLSAEAPDLIACSKLLLTDFLLDLG